ncbi:MAG: DUF6483 family protein [Bacillota bacterium]
MFQKDYIMRMIEQFANVLAKVMGLKSTHKHEESMQVLNDALYDFTGLSEETIAKLSYRDIINIVCGANEINPEKCFMLAELLKEKADVFANMDEMNKAFNLYLKSLNVYVEVILINKTSYLEPNFGTIDQTINILKQYQLPYETQKLLFQYYEHIMKYDKAEDELFDLLDQDSSDSNVLLSEGAAFYERLKRKRPEELKRGNLPMDEVLEGMEKIKGLKR